jgi:hypothetical protein
MGRFCHLPYDPQGFLCRFGMFGMELYKDISSLDHVPALAKALGNMGSGSV